MGGSYLVLSNVRICLYSLHNFLPWLLLFACSKVCIAAWYVLDLKPAGRIWFALSFLAQWFVNVTVDGWQWSHKARMLWLSYCALICTLCMIGSISSAGYVHRYTLHV